MKGIAGVIGAVILIVIAIIAIAMITTGIEYLIDISEEVADKISRVEEYTTILKTMNITCYLQGNEINVSIDNGPLPVILVGYTLVLDNEINITKLSILIPPFEQYSFTREIEQQTSNPSIILVLKFRDHYLTYPTICRTST